MSLLYIVHLLLLYYTDSMPLDDMYEKGVNQSTKIYQYTQDGSGDTSGKYTVIHEDTPTMPKIALLDSKKVFAHVLVQLYG